MFSQHDCTVLRDLARRVAEIAALPIMEERRRLWARHNRLQPARPMILVYPEGAWGELITDAMLQCTDPHARGMEYELRMRIYGYEHFDSDNVVEAEWVVQKAIHSTGWGLEAHRHASMAERGAWSFDPVIKTPADLKKLSVPEISYDAAVTEQWLASMQDVFGDILAVKLKGVSHISFHLMNQYTALRGLEEVMIDMYEEPEMLHDAMAFLEEGHRRVVEQYIDLNLLSLNNDGTYQSSGGVGYTDELPRPDFDPERIGPCDMWASAEAQEMAQVSPEMHAEFILPYEKRLLAPFGLNGYGCCEDLTQKLDDVLTIPNIRRISIAPWADVEACADKLQDKAIFSWKPNPAYLVGNFDEEHTRAYVGRTLAAARGCVLEMILKDTHTCEHHPERFDAWTRIVRELVEVAV